MQDMTFDITVHVVVHMKPPVPGAARTVPVWEIQPPDKAQQRFNELDDFWHRHPDAHGNFKGNRVWHVKARLGFSGAHGSPLVWNLERVDGPELTAACGWCPSTEHALCGALRDWTIESLTECNLEHRFGKSLEDRVAALEREVHREAFIWNIGLEGCHGKSYDRMSDAREAATHAINSYRADRGSYPVIRAKKRGTRQWERVEWMGKPYGAWYINGSEVVS